MNDVYELTPVSGGTEGGLARVATLRANLRAENPNTYTILAGDLLNPSALSTAEVDGERLAGRQMVDVMNILGLDYATFGNHEFDLTQERLLQRLAESKFKWVSSNVTQAGGEPFPNVPPNVTFTAKNEDGKEVRVGLFGLTLGSNPAAYVAYKDPVAEAEAQVAALRDQVDILIAVTHLSLEADTDLVQRVPEIDFVLGGHEHENAEIERGSDFTPVSKADANARSVYVHRLRFDTSNKQPRPRVDAPADNSRAGRRAHRRPGGGPVGERRLRRLPGSGLRADEGGGHDPGAARRPGGERAQLRHQADRPDGRGNAARRAGHRAGHLQRRLDPARRRDPSRQGITEYDILRTVPFGDGVVSAQMSGGLLQRALDQGRANLGTGGYLQTANVTRNADDDGWLINGAPLDVGRSYPVAINDFLLTGREIKLDFLTRDNPELTVTGEHGDIRKALIAELQR